MFRCKRPGAHFYEQMLFLVYYLTEYIINFPWIPYIFFLSLIANLRNIENFLSAILYISFMTNACILSFLLKCLFCHSLKCLAHLFLLFFCLFSFFLLTNFSFHLVMNFNKVWLLLINYLSAIFVVSPSIDSRQK